MKGLIVRESIKQSKREGRANARHKFVFYCCLTDGKLVAAFYVPLDWGLTPLVSDP